MPKGKKYSDAVRRYDGDAVHASADAVALVGSLATAKFDESVDVVFSLGVDPRKADQMIRATVALPSGTGKNVRIAVFAQGEAAQAARDAGAVAAWLSGSGPTMACLVEPAKADIVASALPTVGAHTKVLNVAPGARIIDPPY